MRIIVFSDSHGHIGALERIYQKHPNADRYIHLGDGMHDVQAMRAGHPGINLYSVKGNCDVGSPDPEKAAMEICGRAILYTHGHTFSVKYGINDLASYARERGFDIVLFGHTHTPLYDFYTGRHFLNPGCAYLGGKCRFGIVDITRQGVVCSTAEIEE
jgi:putative phosphoesterase